MDMDLVRIVNGAIPQTTKVSCGGYSCDMLLEPLVFISFFLCNGIAVCVSYIMKLAKNLCVPGYNAVFYTGMLCTLKYLISNGRGSSGSGRVGKIVAQAAAKFLTPVTLEVCVSSHSIVSPN